MIIVDIFIILFVLSLVGIGGPIVVGKLLRMDPRRKEIEAAHNMDEMGEVNTVRHNLNEMRRCTICKKATDPAHDLRLAASWVHQDCYLNEIQPWLDKKDKDNA